MRRCKYDRGSIIGSLIDEALFEFTSLEEEAAAAAAKAAGNGSAQKHGSAPLQLGSFENVQGWADDLGDLGLDVAPPATSSDSFELGNLAALEDDPLSGRTRSDFPRGVSSAPPPAAMKPVIIPAAAPLPRPIAPQVAAPQMLPSDDEDEYPKPKGKGGVIAIVVLLVAIVGAAGAYFGGVIPHH
jgi:serine/threonine-protein kinase